MIWRRGLGGLLPTSVNSLPADRQGKHLRVVRVYHAGRDASHRERDEALVRRGLDITLVVPSSWPHDPTSTIDAPFEVIELPVARSGDVNRHRFADPDRVTELIEARRPDVVDLHEEPFSAVVHQILRRLAPAQPVVCYTAQNIDKRFPPPFAQWERRALGRLQGMYPCTRQAASVVAGKGFVGAMRVLPLAPSSAIRLGSQVTPASSNLRLLMVGRLVAEKGVLDAIQVLAEVQREFNATLDIVGAGPEVNAAVALAGQLGVSKSLEIHPWISADALAKFYADAHVVLTPSRSTRTWVEQYGRMAIEAQAAGAVVVGYRSGSLPEVVGDSGVLVAEGDVASLVAAVKHAANRWAELRKAGLLAAASRTWDSVAAGQSELYDLAAAEAPRHGRAVARRAYAERIYGPPARVAGGERPFALPLLRQDNLATRSLARAVDIASGRTAIPQPETLQVVFVDHVARISGAEVALVRLIGALPNVRSHVILAEDGPLRAALESAGASVEILPLSKSARDFRRADASTGFSAARALLLTALYTVRLARRLRTLKPDLVHTNSLKSGYYGSIAAKLARLPVVWHLHDRLADDYLPRRAAQVTRFALLHLPDLVVCASDAALSTTGLPAGSQPATAVVPYPYDPPALQTKDPRPGLVVGMVGRLSAWKGQDVFLRAFAEAFGDEPTIRGKLVGSAMFGESDYEAELRELVNSLGLQDRIVFTGFTDRVENELAQLDILVHASIVPEPFGQVIVEGMAAGLAVIAAAAGGPLEIVTSERDGLLVRPGDVAVLAAALRRLSEDVTLRQRLGSAAIERARDYAPGPIGARFLNLYREVLTAQGR